MTDNALALAPDWIEELGLRDPEGTCACGRPCTTTAPEEAAAPEGEPVEPVEWAVPGVPFGEAERVEQLPPVSLEISRVASLLDGLATVSPANLPAAQALVDGQALLQLEQQLRVLNLTRVGDVAARGLHELVGFRSAKTWLRSHRPDGDAGDARLAVQLRTHPALQAAVADGLVPLASARKVALALAKLAACVDRADGTIDGVPGEQVLPAVVRHVVTLLCRHLTGLADDDPRLQALLQRAEQTLDAPTQVGVLDAALTWLAEDIPARQLAGPLDEIVCALLPSELEDRADQGHQRRGLSLTPLEDGSGWHLCGDLDLEAGERLWTALRAEAHRDPHNPDDTQAWERARGNGTADLWSLGADLHGVDDPRGRRARLHDALNRLLARYLEHGLGGTHLKRPVQISVTLTDTAVTDEPGAPPPTATSGRLLPRGLVRRWWCDATVTSYVMTLGGKALRAVHSQRTHTADEHTALLLESGGRCAGDGCCPDTPNPLVPLRAHHVLGYAENLTTSLDESILVCDTLHHDLHTGKKTVRLRDGRYLRENGYVDAPTLFDAPPF